jgi:hypothetical protein
MCDIRQEKYLKCLTCWKLRLKTVETCCFIKHLKTLICVCPCIIDICGEEKGKPTRCHLMIYCSYELHYMFRALICPSSGEIKINVSVFKRVLWHLRVIVTCVLGLLQRVGRVGCVA